FTSEGANETVVITMPRGAYAPDFMPRKSAHLPDTRLKPQTGEEVSPNGREEETVAEIEIVQKPALRHWLAFAAVLLVAIAASVAATRYVLQSRTALNSARPAGAITDFWGQFFDRPNE